MCIMEVREGQHNSTIAQAQAHNINTVINDLSMFSHLLEHRGLQAHADRTRALQGTLINAYQEALDLYSDFLAMDITKDEAFSSLLDGVDVTSLKDAIEEIVRRDENRARVFETRK